MYNDIIINYSKNPVNKEELDIFDIEYFEENDSCGDELKVYIKIDDNKIKSWSFTWDAAIITTACASIFWEKIIWMSLEEVLKKDFNFIKKIIETDVSSRRKNASVLWLLTTHNAIHKFLEDEIEETFDDVI